ncbi:MAG: hypothetical protein IPN46_00470 [Saprospiraceae bacterium]|nr:hypothetical protein [Saprospiraceae bacterium]
MEPDDYELQGFDKYIEPFIADDNKTQYSNCRNWFQSSGFCPIYKFRYLDPDADKVFALFEIICQEGNQSFFNGPFQSPDSFAQFHDTLHRYTFSISILKHKLINLKYGLMCGEYRDQYVIPYYMITLRETGARDYFAVSLVMDWEICQGGAYTSISCMNVRSDPVNQDIVLCKGIIHMLGLS